MYSITSESARHPDILSLIAALDRYQSELYPAESNHLIDLAAQLQHAVRGQDQIAGLDLVLLARLVGDVGCKGEPRDPGLEAEPGHGVAEDHRQVELRQSGRAGHGA